MVNALLFIFAAKFVSVFDVIHFDEKACTDLLILRSCNSFPHTKAASERCSVKEVYFLIADRAVMSRCSYFIKHLL